MYRGYVKFWRKAIEAGWLQNHKLWVFWSWCLMKASHKEYDQVVGCQQVHLMPGDFIFGLNNASEETNISIQSIRTILGFLKTSENLTIKSTNKFSIISIVKWDTYQSEENEINTQTNKPLTNNQQTTNNKQEYKNKRNINKEYIIYHENIKLTEKEFNGLQNEFGLDVTNKAIKYLSDYKTEKSYKTKSDNLTIRRWVIDAVRKKENTNAGTTTYRKPYRTERDANNAEALDTADRIAREYEAKVAALNNPKDDA